MKRILLTLAVCALMVTPALAEPTLQEVLDSITLLPIPGASSVDVATDTIADGLDSYWTITGGASASTIVIELAGRADITNFGVYDMTDSAVRVQVFNGAASSGDSHQLSIWADGSVRLDNVDTLVDFAGNAFGYYLEIPRDGDLYFSDTSLNGDAYDHMWALQGKGDKIQIPNLIPSFWNSNEYILGWENTIGGGDYDHQDFVVMVESVQPIIPAPGAILLGSIGVSIVGWLRRRRTL